MKRVVLLAGICVAATALAVPIVSNVEMRQVEGTKLVKITYDVADDVNTQLWASVSISTNGVPLPSGSVTGDVFCVMEPGIDKAIIWDAGADWNGRYTEIAEAIVDVMMFDTNSVCRSGNLSLSSSGSANWVTDRSVYYTPQMSWRSGAISHSQTTSFTTTVSGPGVLSFVWKVSSEANCDKLSLYIDGTLVKSISGSVDWERYTRTITGASSHTIQWRYSKDGSNVAGNDCGWIDDVSWQN